MVLDEGLPGRSGFDDGGEFRTDEFADDVGERFVAEIEEDFGVVEADLETGGETASELDGGVLLQDVGEAADELLGGFFAFAFFPAVP